jgi:hypothetical protein
VFRPHWRVSVEQFAGYEDARSQPRAGIDLIAYQALLRHRAARVTHRRDAVQQKQRDCIRGGPVRSGVAIVGQAELGLTG